MNDQAATAIPAPGPRLAEAQSAVTEAIADNGGRIDWFGAAKALTDAHLADINQS